MRKHRTLLGWPQRNPQRYRFTVPNEVWEYKLRPVEFVIFSHLCYWQTYGKEENMVSVKLMAVTLHLTSATVEKHLAALISKSLITKDGIPTLKCEAGKFFTLPNEIFLLNLPPSAFMVYAYLLLIENRRTHTCHPSYNTIAAETGLSKNTALKNVGVLLEKKLITVEATSYFDQHGMKWKGNNLYTILPIRMAVEDYHQRQLHQQKLATERSRIRKRQAKRNHRRPTAALCASAPTPAVPGPIPSHMSRCAPVERPCTRGRKGEQDKPVASQAPPRQPQPPAVRAVYGGREWGHKYRVKTKMRSQEGQSQSHQEFEAMFLGQKEGFL